MSETTYGPSKAAFNHAVNALEARTKADVALEDLSEAFDALHDPALGLDASVCKRAVIERVEALAVEISADSPRDAMVVQALAERLERDWRNAS
jgi:hypothetical protein